MHTQAIIDVCCERYGRPTTDSTARAKILKWVNHAQDEIMGLGARTPEGVWWFRVTSVLWEIVSGQAEYTFDLGRGSTILNLLNASAVRLGKVSRETFLALYRDASITQISDAPTRWALIFEDARIKQIRVWPTPLANGNGLRYSETDYEDLTDATSSITLIPEQFHRALIDKAMALMLLNDGQAAEAQSYDKRFTDAMGTMEAKHRAETRMAG